MDITLDKKKSFTEGTLFSKIFLFVLPLMATNLLQVLYNTADMIVVGLSTEPDAVGAIGITSSFVNLVVGIAMGFSVGITVIVSQAIGAKNDEKVSRGVHTGILVGLIIGAIGGIVGFFCSVPIMSLMGNRGKLLNLSSLYTKIYFCGLPFILLTNCQIAIFRAKGDAKTPLIVLTISGISNVLLNMFFVLVLEMSVEGVAIATVMSNVISAVVLFIKLTKDDTNCRVNVKKLKMDMKTFGEIAKIGIPAGFQGALFSLSNMIIQSSILSVNNAYYPADTAFQPIVKGNSVASSLESIASNAVDAVYHAIVTVVGQNYGAKEFKRVKKTMLDCYIISAIVATVFGCGIYILRNPLMSLYGVVKGAEGSLERAAYDACVTRMRIMMLVYFTLAFMNTGSGCLRGLGRSTISTLVSFTGSCVFRIVWIYTVFKAYFTLEAIYISYPISWALTALVHFMCSMIILKKEEKAYKEKQERHKAQELAA